MDKPYQIVPLQDCSDHRGHMQVLSFSKELPFVVKRAFFMYGSADNAVRGGHANLYSSMAFVCMQGSCRLAVDDGQSVFSLSLHRPDEMIVVAPSTWKTLDRISDDCILLVLSDMLYSESDIERDYTAFQKRKQRSD